MHLTSWNRLSARLYEATGDEKYHDAAELSAQFIKNHLYNGVIILDTLVLSDCSLQTGALTYNSGFTIEGISALATKNDSWTGLCVFQHRSRSLILTYTQLARFDLDCRSIFNMDSYD